MTIWAETRLSGEPSYAQVAYDVPVAGGRFEAPVRGGDLPAASARLFALPYDASPYDAASVPSGGPIVHGGGEFTYRDGDGRVVFFGGAQRSQPGGAAAAGPVGGGRGPLRSLAARSPSFGNAPGVTAAATTDGNDLHGVFLGSSSLLPGYSPARSALTVDGRSVWPRDTVTWSSDDGGADARREPSDGLTPDELQPVEVTRTVGGDWGQTVVERQRVYASADPEEDGSSRPDRFVDAGVELVRTTVQDHDGRRITVRDEYRPTDGRAHQVDALYAMGVVSPGSDLRARAARESADDASVSAFRVPWETGGDRFTPRAFLEPLGAPRGDVATVFSRVPALNGDRDGAPAYGAITFGTRLDGGVFMPGYASSGIDAASAFIARFVRDVPAGGAATIPVVYSTGTNAGEVEAAAAQVERELTPPAPAVSAPVQQRTVVTVPVPQPAARAVPRALTLRATLRTQRRGRVQVRLRGALGLPAGTPAAVCVRGGTVALQIQAGKRTLSVRRVRLAKDCSYDVTVRFASTRRFGKAKRLTASARWNGNALLGTAASVEKRVAFR
ncbi:hypothetical protein [Patulibacter sp. SYSU D01012]|uniref:hypothetical protein n=1 Tax=Patulibacter sp. SYSU D01012 TaxID=2817381 RepID=UPI001B30D6C7|nr:hypothetical protein [Patulibacter sp. SYSU D01012]